MAKTVLDSEEQSDKTIIQVSGLVLFTRVPSTFYPYQGSEYRIGQSTGFPTGAVCTGTGEILYYFRIYCYCLLMLFSHIKKFSIKYTSIEKGKKIRSSLVPRPVFELKRNWRNRVLNLVNTGTYRPVRNGIQNLGQYPFLQI